MRYSHLLRRWCLLAMVLVLAGCAAGGPRVGGAPPRGLNRDQLLSELAACHLLRVAQAQEKAVTDATVIAVVQRYGVSMVDVVTRANQLLARYRSDGAALGRRAGQACVNLAALTGVTPALVRLGPSGPAPSRPAPSGPAAVGAAPFGPERRAWLRVSAEITPGFADRVIRELRAGRAVGLIINSPGGSVYEARKLGSYLRANGLPTAVDQVCVSACIDVLAGGTERYATRNARLGVHQSRVPGRPGSYAGGSYEGGQVYVAESVRYLRQMGVDPDVAIAAASVPNDRLLLIPLRDALETRLLTAVVERL